MTKNARNFVFTLNNYTEEHIQQLSSLLDGKAKYVAFSREVAPSTGTPHLQGYLNFANSVNFKTLMKRLPWHLEIMRGSFHQNEIYCSKQAALEKFGEEPKSTTDAAKLAASERWDLAKQGRFEELAPEHIKIYEYIHAKYASVKSRPHLDNIWIYGDSGCGKTSYCNNWFPGHYRKAWNKWWDGYMNEDTVVIDDLSPEHAKYLSDYLKWWCDHSPFPAEVKGGKLTIRPRTVIVTSQYTIEECFPDRKTFMAISRRFTYRLSYNPMYKKLCWEDESSNRDIYIQELLNEL